MAVQHSANLIEQMTKPGIPRKLIQRRLAQAGLGIVRALQNSTMTIEDAENDLFNLDTYRTARRRRYDAQLLKFLEWGLELGDVAELAPNGLQESYDQMERLLLRVISSSLGRTSPRSGSPRKRSAPKKPTR